jgi:hypothetical protein
MPLQRMTEPTLEEHTQIISGQAEKVKQAK